MGTTSSEAGLTTDMEKTYSTIRKYLESFVMASEYGLVAPFTGVHSPVTD